MTAHSTKWTDLNFKVEYPFYRQFRIVAAITGVSMKALLEDMAETKFKEVAHIYPEYFRQKWARHVPDKIRTVRLASDA
jgi:hypothetical protein